MPEPQPLTTASPGKSATAAPAHSDPGAPRTGCGSWGAGIVHTLSGEIANVAVCALRTPDCCDFGRKRPWRAQVCPALQVCGTSGAPRLCGRRGAVAASGSYLVAGVRLAPPGPARRSGRPQALAPPPPLSGRETVSGRAPDSRRRGHRGWLGARGYFGNPSRGRLSPGSGLAHLGASHVQERRHLWIRCVWILTDGRLLGGSSRGLPSTSPAPLGTAPRADVRLRGSRGKPVPARPERSWRPAGSEQGGSRPG
jgi:hypothetical protein